MKTKKRWKPKVGEKFWHLEWSDGPEMMLWEWGHRISSFRFGVYKTKYEAELMMKKINSFITKEIRKV